MEPTAVPERLDALVAELRDCDRRERIELLIDLARDLPPVPEALAALKDEAHRVHECQSPVFLFVQVEGDRVALHADVPPEAPTVRGFVSLLVEGLGGATVDDVMAVPPDLIDRSGIGEILGMQRTAGLHAVLRRLKREVAQAARETSG